VSQRTSKDKIVTFREPVDSWQKGRNWRPKPGNGVCEHCGQFDVRGLTRVRASRYLLCHSCISSSRIRDMLALNPKPESK
jgi:hypothetical protein